MPPVTTAYAYNTRNQLLTATEGGVVTTYTYDFSGNRQTRVRGGLTDTYAYDYENRLVVLSKTTPGGTGYYNYVYDYRTRRVERNDAGAVTRTVYSGGVSVSDSSGSTLNAEFIRGSDWGGGVGGLLYSLRGGTPSFKHYNSRGDVITATNASGATTWQASYEAFGRRTQETGTTLDRQKANTKEEDPTGLLNEGFRYRDLETGAFITRDPLGFVDGPNVYAYVVQNPWSKFDPEGLYETVVTNEQAQELPDSTDIINKYVNNVIKEAYAQNKGKHLGSAGIAGVVHAKMTNRSGLFGNDTNIVKDLKASNPNHFLKGDVAGTKYDSALRVNVGAGVMLKYPNEVINRNIASGMNIKGEAIGSDKLDHMFNDGFELRNMPEESARARSEDLERGKHGLNASGVFSHGDIEANLAGRNFYRDLNEAYAAGKDFSFDISGHPLDKMNENKNLNEYSASVKIDVEENEKKLKKKK